MYSIKCLLKYMALTFKKQKKKINKWTEKNNGKISYDQGKHIFYQPFIETDESKLQRLQF